VAREAVPSAAPDSLAATRGIGCAAFAAGTVAAAAGAVLLLLFLCFALFAFFFFGQAETDGFHDHHFLEVFHAGSDDLLGLVGAGAGGGGAGLVDAEELEAGCAEEFLALAGSGVGGGSTAVLRGSGAGVGSGWGRGTGCWVDSSEHAARGGGETC